MKKYIYTLLIFVAFCKLNGNEFCEQNNYNSENEFCENVCLEKNNCVFSGFSIGAFGGINFLQQRSSIGFVGGVSLGYKLKNNFRVEGEIAYRQNCNTKFGYNLKTKTYSYIANIYSDINLSSKWNPYFGVGIGYGHSITNVRRSGFSYFDRSVKYSTNNVAYQGIVGINGEILEDTFAGLEYRCFFLRDKLEGHSILISLKYYL